jgi:cellulase
MSCYQVVVGGSGTTNPPTVKLPGAYSPQDPGILINIYTQLNAYTSESLLLNSTAFLLMR